MSAFTDKVIKYNARLMRDLNIDKVQACGIWGNLGTETGGFTALQEKAPTVKGSRGGYGWMQWTGPRRKKYEEWCKVNNLNAADDETNYQYLVKETLTDEVHSLERLRKTTTLEAATETFMAQNLRPGKKNLDSRVRYAKLAFENIQEKSKDSGMIASTGAVIAGGAVVTASSPSHMWLWIIAGTFIAIGIAWALVHATHARVEDKSTGEVFISKKGKK